MATIPPALISAPVSAMVGGQAAQVMWAGNAPECVQGVMQVNIQLPAGVAGKGSVPIIFSIGGNSSQSTITVAVK
jgi:uncharacterized protein (TIGR03437 family)